MCHSLLGVEELKTARCSRLAFGGTSSLTSKLLSLANQSLLKGCGLHLQGRITTESLDSKPCCFEVTAEKILSFGRTQLQQIFGENNSTSSSECEVLRICESALSLPLSNCFSDTSTGCTSIGVCENGDSISRALWHAAEERWKDATDMLSDYTPDKILHTVCSFTWFGCANYATRCKVGKNHCSLYHADDLIFARRIRWILR